MITKDAAAKMRHGEVLYFVYQRNADGSPSRCRVMGKCKTWKRQPERFRLPVKHGMYTSFYITQDNADLFAETEVQVVVEGP